MKASLKESCNTCNSPINWFIKLLILSIMLFVLASSLYYYYKNYSNSNFYNNSNYFNSKYINNNDSKDLKDRLTT